MIMLPVLLTWTNPVSFKSEGKHNGRQKLQGSFRYRDVEMPAVANAVHAVPTQVAVPVAGGYQ